MAIYYLMVEVVPNYNNPESNKFGGAYINCWVKWENGSSIYWAKKNMMMGDLMIKERIYEFEIQNLIDVVEEYE